MHREENSTCIGSVPWDAVQFGISAWINANLNNIIANLSPTHKTDLIIICGPISSLEADGVTYPRVMLDRSPSSRVTTRWGRAEWSREEGPPELLLHPDGLVCFWIWKRWKVWMRCWQGNKVEGGETAKRKNRVSLFGFLNSAAQKWNISSSMWYVQAFSATGRILIIAVKLSYVSSCSWGRPEAFASHFSLSSGHSRWKRILNSKPELN